MSAEFPKRCACNAVYTRAHWYALEPLGEQDDGVEVLDLRQCTACQSTMAIVLGPSPSSDAGALAASETCWTCSEGVPVAVVDVPRQGRVPVCERCSLALREAAPAASEVA
jgi:hypothetical protein